mgnify:CR=1 FL=1
MSKRALKSEEYLNVTYSETRTPKSNYPLLLAGLIYSKYCKFKAKRPHIFLGSQRVLDIGCGRGDFLEAFSQVDKKVKVSGVDISPAAFEASRGLDVEVLDLEKGIPGRMVEKYHLAFSKSVIEHMHDPMTLVRCAFECLKVDGMVVIMTPSWLHNYKHAFYVDHTHVSPFTKLSLSDIMKIAGFKDVEVEYFIQLPCVWNNPFLRLFSKVVSCLPIPYAPLYDVPWGVSNPFNKFVRFSKEVMLLGVGRK